VASVLERLGPAVDERLRPLFARARLPYPPRVVHLLAFKQERKIELWAEAGGPPAFVRSYRVLRASGKPGPKLQEGDWQVPEGLYRVTWLNPRSDYHLSLKLDYPNAFDRVKARQEDRGDLGGDIFIHGSDVSAGCLAVGDPAVEELFVLAARVGASNVRVLIAPSDLRRGDPPEETKYRPPWLPELYAQLRAELERFRCC
jgi:murein L,D-transpeptidase YafK